MKTTQAQRDELRRLVKAATAGPWRFANSNSMRRIGTENRDGDVLHGFRAGDGVSDVQISDADGEVIVAARNALDDLLDDIETLRGLLGELVEKIKETERRGPLYETRSWWEVVFNKAADAIAEPT